MFQQKNNKNYDRFFQLKKRVQLNIEMNAKKEIDDKVQPVCSAH